MRITLFTDPHLGTRRTAHTTRESSKKLTAALYEQAMRIVTNAENPVCLGDLFDKSANPEEIIVQGFNVASRCRWTLAGNHDCSNRADTVTSLDAIKEMGCSIISSPNLHAPYFDAHGPLYFVPHHASQQLFEQAMVDAASHAADERAGKASVLMLHCNYDQPFAKEDDTLNLSPAVAEQLLVAFDYIFLGHEHKPSKHLDGRVVILGNTHVTSFADISDKYCYTLSIGDDHVSLDKQLIWSTSERFREIRFGDEIHDLTGVQFVSVFGIAEAEQSVAVADFVQEIWAGGADLLAVRNNVMIGQAFNEVQEPGESKLGDLKAHIAAELQGTDLADLFSTLAAEVSA